MGNHFLGETIQRDVKQSALVGLRVGARLEAVLGDRIIGRQPESDLPTRYRFPTELPQGVIEQPEFLPEPITDTKQQGEQQ